MDWRPYINVDPAILNGKAHFKGTQITVEAVLKEIAEGISVKEGSKSHPSLGEKAIMAALAYAAQISRDYE